LPVLLKQHIFLSTLFSNTCTLQSSQKVKDHVSHPYVTSSKTVVLCIVIFSSLENVQDGNNFGIRNKKHLQSLFFFQSS